MKFKKPPVEPLELNLTPLIDCLLVIVVCLLLTTTFSKFSRLNIILPQATGVPPAKKGDRVEVRVSADGHYSVGGHALTSQGEDELMTAIKQVSGNDVTKPIVIAADSKAAHQDVVRVMDVAGKLGFVNLNISTRIPLKK